VGGEVLRLILDGTLAICLATSLGRHTGWLSIGTDLRFLTIGQPGGSKSARDYPARFVIAAIQCEGIL
jgi:hypothetical protein